MKYRNLKITAKLLSGFLIMALITGVVGVIVVLNLMNSSKGYSDMYSNYGIGANEISQVAVNFQLSRVALRNMALDVNPDKQKYIKQINEANQEINDRMGSYESTITFEDDQKDYIKLQELMKQYRTESDSTMNILNSGTSLEQAAVMINRTEPSAEAVESQLDHMITWNIDGGHAKSEDLTHQVELTVTFMAVIVIIAFVIALVLGIMISRIISKPIIALKNAAEKLAVGDVNVQIQQTSTDEVGQLTGAFSEMVKNIADQANHAQRIAEGCLSIDIIPKSEQDVLSLSMKKVVETLRKLVEEADHLTKAAVDGELEIRGSLTGFEGGYKDILEGFHHTLDAIVEPLHIASDYIKRLSDGELVEIAEHNLKGEYSGLIRSITLVADALHTLTDETQKLTGAAVSGDLSYRADVNLLKGSYANIIEEINCTLDSLINPLNTAASYIKQIGNGQIPEKITEEYMGDFNDIKISINSCIDGLGGLTEGRDVLGRMSLNDYTTQVEGSYQGIYAEIAMSVNAVSDRVRNVVRILNNIAAGDLSDLETLQSIGRRSENDRLMPSMAKMMETIEALLQEANLLSNAVIEGKLNTQSDTAQFEGAWKTLVIGMNRIMKEVETPLMDVVRVMEELSTGNLQASLTNHYGGSFEVLAQTVNHTAGYVSDVVGEITFVTGQIAEGNLALDHVKPMDGDYVNISDSLNIIIDSLNQVLGDINEAAEQVASGSRQVSEGSQTLSQGSTEQASAIQQLTASITEIASQIKQNAINANQASGITSLGRENAEKGNDHMKDLLRSMDEINSSSVNISKIIKVIDDIAFQTNILALNAAVEAARAGQHGKGFAVVAEEVRNLAARSAAAAKETTDLIEGSVHKAQSGTKIANETADALTEIIAGIEKSVGFLGGISDASNEQATGIAQINRGIEQVA